MLEKVDDTWESLMQHKVQNILTFLFFNLMLILHSLIISLRWLTANSDLNLFS